MISCNEINDRPCQFKNRIREYNQFDFISIEIIYSHRHELFNITLPLMKKFALPFVLNLICQCAVTQVQVSNLLCENLTNPIGLDVSVPRFSWQLISDKRNLMQAAYEIRVGNSISSIGKNKDLVWSTGKVNSDSSVHITYKGAPLRSGAKYFWQV